MRALGHVMWYHGKMNDPLANTPTSTVSNAIETEQRFIHLLLLGKLDQAQQLEPVSDNCYNAALNVAVATNRVDSVAYVLDNTTCSLTNALWICATQNQMECLTLLLDNPRSRVDDDALLSALCGAIQAGCMEPVVALMEVINPKDFEGAFQACLQFGNVDAGRLLYERCDARKAYNEFCAGSWMDADQARTTHEVMSILDSEATHKTLSGLNLQSNLHKSHRM